MANARYVIKKDIEPSILHCLRYVTWDVYFVRSTGSKAARPCASFDTKAEAVRYVVEERKGIVTTEAKLLREREIENRLP